MSCWLICVLLIRNREAFIKLAEVKGLGFVQFPANSAKEDNSFSILLFLYFGEALRR